jgi:SAM-dependent methyltransferase
MMTKVVDAGTILKQLAHDRTANGRTMKVSFRNVDGTVGQRDFATHWIHHYPAKMFHRIPRAILDSVSKRSSVIVDPFCGSGTVLLEGILKGHTVFGIDVSPAACLISRAKITPISPAHLKRHLVSIISRARQMRFRSAENEALDYWFKRNVRKTLEALCQSIRCIRHKECRDFYLVTLSSIVRRSSFADPAVPPPVKLTEERAKRANGRYREALDRALAMTPGGVFDLFEKAVRQNLRRMETLYLAPDKGEGRILEGVDLEASTTGLEKNSIDLVITSPPYCGAQKYLRSVRLELLILGYDESTISSADKRTLGTERVNGSKSQPFVPTRFIGTNRLIRRVHKRNPVRARMLSDYVSYIDKFAKELTRILKPGGHAFVTFGTDHVAGHKVDSGRIFARAAQDHGLRHIATLVDSIPSRGMITDRHSTARTINDERIVWLRR